MIDIETGEYEIDEDDVKASRKTSHHERSMQWQRRVLTGEISGIMAGRSLTEIYSNPLQSNSSHVCAEFNLKKEQKLLISTILEMEGTAEEIRVLLSDFSGQRLRVTIRPLAHNESLLQSQEEFTLVEPESNERLATKFRQKLVARLTEEIQYNDVELPSSLAGAIW